MKRARTARYTHAATGCVIRPTPGSGARVQIVLEWHDDRGSHETVTDLPLADVLEPLMRQMGRMLDAVEGEQADA